MRAGVKRPAPGARPVVKAVKARPAAKTPGLARAAGHTLLPAKTEMERLARAAAVKQSKLVRKFGDVISPASQPALAATVAPLPVQPAPLQHKPLMLGRPSPKTESLLQKGLRNANSHEQAGKKRTKTRRKGSKLATYAAGALAALILVGFVAYQNIPNISVRYAAARSGVAASLPGYQPSGFSLSNRIKYNSGQITLEYKSNSDQRGYTITQRDSNWNSEALKTSYVLSASDQAAQTYEDKGRTIYLYGESNATWVSNGVWYDINGDSKLNSDQLIRIATSL